MAKYPFLRDEGDTPSIVETNNLISQIKEACKGSQPGRHRWSEQYELSWYISTSFWIKFVHFSHSICLIEISYTRLYISFWITFGLFFLHPFVLKTWLMNWSMELWLTWSQESGLRTGLLVFLMPWWRAWIYAFLDWSTDRRWAGDRTLVLQMPQLWNGEARSGEKVECVRGEEASQPRWTVERGESLDWTIVNWFDSDVRTADVQA